MSIGHWCVQIWLSLDARHGFVECNQLKTGLATVFLKSSRWFFFNQRTVTVFFSLVFPFFVSIIMAKTWDAAKFDKDMQALMEAKLPISESKIKTIKSNAMAHPQVSQMSEDLKVLSLFG